MAQQASQHGVPAPRDATNWFAIIRGIVTDPLATFTVLAETQPLRSGLVLYLLSSLAGGLVNLARPIATGSMNKNVADLVASPVFAIGAAFVGGPIFLLAIAGLLYQIGLRQGGDGPFSRLLTTELYKGATIGLISSPLYLVLYLAMRGTGDALTLVSFLPSLIFSLWGLYLTVYSLRASLRLSTGDAVATVVYTILVGLLIVVLGACLF